MIGKKIRLERIIDRNTRRTVIVPLDHGMTVGPIPGLVQIAPPANLIAEGGANAAVVHRGAAMFGHRGYGKDLGLILHLSASTTLSPDSNRKVLVATVEDAIQIGADAVSIHVNLGAEDEATIQRLVRRHYEYTRSARADEVLRKWNAFAPKFVKVFPKDLKLALDARLQSGTGDG